jgi:hypothetical protein
MEATFWIETAEFTIEVPVFEPGQPPLIIPAQTGAAGQPVPEFLVNPPIAITAPRAITVKATQIQYSQQVFLNFQHPHVAARLRGHACAGQPHPRPVLRLCLRRAEPRRAVQNRPSDGGPRS